jgi:CheY-like chemotaxis protein
MVCLEISAKIHQGELSEGVGSSSGSVWVLSDLEPRGLTLNSDRNPPPPPGPLAGEMRKESREPLAVSILLVEDNPADVHLVRESLKLHNVTDELTVFRDGARAIQYIDAIDGNTVACPQLVVLDLNLPKTSGREVLKRIRSSQRCAETPVVILSSSGAQRDREDARLLGATQYIRKPSELSEFMAIGATLKKLVDASRGTPS